MQLDDYFEKTRGVSVLCTADASGKVNAAIYGRPHFLDDGSIAFIMADRLTHANLQSNPSAVFLFKEDGSYKGKRLYLTKIREEKDSPLIGEIRRHKSKNPEGQANTESKFLVYFRVDEVLPLTSGGA
jgi:hypothetical protein